MTAGRPRRSHGESGRGRGVARRTFRPLLGRIQRFVDGGVACPVCAARFAILEHGAGGVSNRCRISRYDFGRSENKRWACDSASRRGVCDECGRISRIGRTVRRSGGEGEARRSSGMISCRIGRSLASGRRLRSGKRGPPEKCGFPFAGNAAKSPARHASAGARRLMNSGDGQ